MTESVEELMSNGAGFSAPISPSGGFDAGVGWDSHYDLRAAGVDAVGEVPMPSQTKLDNFQRTMARLFIELDAAEQREREARAAAKTEDEADTKDEDEADTKDEDEADTRPVEERMADIEEAIKLKREVYGKFRDAAANVCSGNPSRAELGRLNDPTFLRFLNWLGGLLDPNS